MLIKIDKELHVQLLCNGCMVPFPAWFVRGQNAQLKRFTIQVEFSFVYEKQYIGIWIFTFGETVGKTIL